MTAFFVVVGCFILLIFLLWLELKQFRVTYYSFESSKIDKKFRIAFLSDVHGKTFEGRLLTKVKALQPDVILIGGDMITKKHPEQLIPMADFVLQLKEIAPVYYGFGNHETTIEEILGVEEEAYGRAFEDYKNRLEEGGITFLRNETQSIGHGVKVSGLELPSEYYQKFEVKPLGEEEMREYLNPKETEEYHILMAHHPVFGETYQKLLPDLILSGHTHGGLVRFPFIGSIISTELTWFPKYDGGSYTLIEGNKRIPFLVSKGLGYHSYPIRILDRAEILLLELSCQDEKNLVE